MRKTPVMDGTLLLKTFLMTENVLSVINSLTDHIVYMVNAYLRDNI